MFLKQMFPNLLFKYQHLDPFPVRSTFKIKVLFLRFFSETWLRKATKIKLALFFKAMTQTDFN